MKKSMKVFRDGIRSFLDYAIELKETQPGLLHGVLADYQALSQAPG